MLAATIVAPGHNMARPLMPEFIAKQDGAEKQDCERGAAKRWLAAHAERVRDLRPVYLGDDLFACQPICEAVLQSGGDFLFTARGRQEAHLPLPLVFRSAAARRQGCAPRQLDRPHHQ